MDAFKHFVSSFALVLVVATATVPAAQAHSGGLDAQGCHTNRKTGEYHCHRAQPPAGSQSEQAFVKKSNSGICHAPSSQWYAQTIHFTKYRSLEECLASGGRLPKG